MKQGIDKQEVIKQVKKKSNQISKEKKQPADNKKFRSNFSLPISIAGLRRDLADWGSTLRWPLLAVGAASLLQLSGCSSTPAYTSARPPAHLVKNLCALSRHNPDIYKAALKAQHRWRTPAYVLLAIVSKESNFHATARSPSDAYGYAQAKDDTWNEYRRATGNWDADRENIYDAMDFVGWYTYKTYKQLGIPRTDVYRQYLVYHEGPTGYKRRYHRKKPWLLRYARSVVQRARLYRRQERRCPITRHYALRDTRSHNGDLSWLLSER